MEIWWGQLPREHKRLSVYVCFVLKGEEKKQWNVLRFFNRLVLIRSSNPFVWLFWLDSYWPKFCSQTFRSGIIEIYFTRLNHNKSHYFCIGIDCDFRVIWSWAMVSFPIIPSKNVGDGIANNSVFFFFKRLLFLFFYICFYWKYLLCFYHNFSIIIIIVGWEKKHITPHISITMSVFNICIYFLIIFVLFYLL